MKAIVLIPLIALFATFSVSAEAKLTKTCVLKANNWLSQANIEIAYSDPMSYQECYEKGKSLFHSTVTASDRTILLRKSAVRVRTWTTQYKKVKIKYFAENNTATVDTLKRESVIESEKNIQVTKMKNIWKCWTQDECVAE